MNHSLSTSAIALAHQFRLGESVAATQMLPPPNARDPHQGGGTDSGTDDSHAPVPGATRLAGSGRLSRI